MRSIAIAAATAAAATAASPAAAGARLGPLPPGAIAHSQVGASDELIGYLAFDPSLVAAKLPVRMRLRTLDELARRIPAVAAHLAAHPEHGGWAYSFYELVRIHGADYDGVKGYRGGAGGMVVWYGYLAREEGADPRRLGSQLVALGSWVSDPRLAAHLRRAGFPADDARLAVRWDARRVRGRFSATTLTIEGRCRLEGSPVEPEFGKTEVSYQTIWTPADQGDTFEVVTWAGHRSRTCADPKWTMTGTHPLARAFNDPQRGAPGVEPTDFEYGYVLASALYRREPSPAP